MIEKYKSMFTGIITEVGVINCLDLNKNLLGITSSLKKLELGESISCSGTCLTVSNVKKNKFFCNLSPETIEKTNLKKKKNGDKINLERSLKVGEVLSGHLVFGHVDGQAVLEKISVSKESWILKFSVSKNLHRYLVEKCSISIDGISLTVNKVYSNFFEVSIIPFTWRNTNLIFAKEGDFFNIEIDMLARYVFKALNK